MTILDFIKVVLVDCWFFTSMPIVALFLYGLYEAIESKWERRFDN